MKSNTFSHCQHVIYAPINDDILPYDNKPARYGFQFFIELAETRLQSYQNLTFAYKLT